MTKVNWLRPCFDNEKDEFNRYIGSKKDFSKKIFFLSKEEAYDKFEQGYITDKLHNHIENYDIRWVKLVSSGRVELDYVLNYYKHLGKNVEIIRKTYQYGGDLPCIILFNVENEYYELVSGNTRLVISMLRLDQPSFYIINL